MQNETLGSPRPDNYRIVSAESLWSVMRWIHLESTTEEFRQLMATRLPMLLLPSALRPMEVMVGGSRVAAGYFSELAGRVATLGGVRANRGFESFAGQLMVRMSDQLALRGILQTQALVDTADKSSEQILNRSNFHRVTSIRQLCKQLSERDQIAARSSWSELLTHDPHWNWQAAHRFSQSEIAALIEQTFHRSLDCPILNGLRSAEEVMHGFLDGRSWNRELPWWVMCHADRPVACCLLNQHTADLFELSYLGLIAPWRGQRLGRHLVQLGIERCFQAGGRYLSSAVDVQNWPAVKIYQSLGFMELRELSVWLPRATAHRMVA